MPSVIKKKEWSVKSGRDKKEGQKNCPVEDLNPGLTLSPYRRNNTIHDGENACYHYTTQAFFWMERFILNYKIVWG
jgi:hypothetical protein